MSAVHVEIPLERFPENVLKQLRQEALHAGISLAELIARKTVQAAEKVTAAVPQK